MYVSPDCPGGIVVSVWGSALMVLVSVTIAGPGAAQIADGCVHGDVDDSLACVMIGLAVLSVPGAGCRRLLLASPRGVGASGSISLNRLVSPASVCACPDPGSPSQEGVVVGPWLARCLVVRAAMRAEVRRAGLSTWSVVSMGTAPVLGVGGVRVPDLVARFRVLAGAVGVAGCWCARVL